MARDSESKNSEVWSIPFGPDMLDRGCDCVTNVGVALTTSALSARSRSAPTKDANSKAAPTDETTDPLWSGSLRKKMAAYGSSVYALAGAVVKTRAVRL